MTFVGRLARPAYALLVVTFAYVVVQLMVVGLHTSLGWDEAIYVSQFGRHDPVAWFDAPRARGITLLAAPVVVVTSNLVVLRLWTTVASATLLYAAFRTWLSVRHTLAIPLAAAGFAALWVTEFYGAEVMPNLYVALGAVTAAGFVVRALSGGGGRAVLGAFVNVAWVALVRPSDAVWLCAGLTVVVVATSWRSVRNAATTVVGALVAGLLTGAAEWIVEAVVRFGSVAERVRLASTENGGRLTFSLPDFARAVDGPLLCRPCAGYHVPWLEVVWWLLLLPLVCVGVVTSVRVGRRVEALVPLAGGLALIAEYVFFITYAAPRFLLPAYALLSLPAATGAVEVTRRLRSRAALRGLPAPIVPAVTGIVGLLFVIQQGFVLAHEVRLRHIGGHDQQQIVTALRHAGVVAPCVLGGRAGFELAYAAGCNVDYDAVKDVLDRPRDAPNETLNDGAADQVTLEAVRGLPARYAVIVVGNRLPPPVVARRWQQIALPDGAYTIYVPPAGAGSRHPVRAP